MVAGQHHVRDYPTYVCTLCVEPHSPPDRNVLEVNVVHGQGNGGDMRFQMGYALHYATLQNDLQTLLFPVTIWGPSHPVFLAPSMSVLKHHKLAV